MRDGDKFNKGTNPAVVEISDSISISADDVRRIEIGEQRYNEKANINNSLDPSDSVELKRKDNDTGCKKRKSNRGDDADVWLNLNMIKNDYGVLRRQVHWIAKELTKLTKAVNKHPALSAGDTVAEVLRQLKPHLTDMVGHPKMATGKSPRAANSAQAESPAINDVKSSQAQSDCSVSPTLPPKPTRRNNKAKTRRRSDKYPGKHIRSLFDKRGNNILFLTEEKSNFSKMGQRQRMNKEGMTCRTVRVGPFNLKHDMSPEDIALLEFIFMERPLTEQESSYDRVVVAGTEAVHLNRYDLLSLGPGQHVCSWVINVFAELLNNPWSEYWYLPTYFGESATNGRHMNGINQRIQYTRKLSRLSRFAGRLRGCKRIFIPMLEEALVNHWWLLVVNPIDQTGEIFDSAPNPVMSHRREADARRVLRMMDNIWFTEDVLSMDVPICFESFRCALAESNQVQPNDYDCGVFVIRNMQMYAKNWALEYVSDQQRASLALECMWHPFNKFPPLDTSVTDCLGTRRERGVQSWVEKLNQSRLAEILDRWRGERAGDDLKG